MEEKDFTICCSELEDELKGLESNITVKNRKFEERLTQLSSATKTLQISDNNFELIANSEAEVPLGTENNEKIVENNRIVHQNGDINEEEDLISLKERISTKKQKYKEELNQLKEMASHRNEIQELEKLKAQIQHKYEEERKMNDNLRQKIRKLETDQIELQKQVNHNIELANQRKNELLQFQKKYPALLRELERISSQNSDFLREKEKFQSQLSNVKNEFLRYREETFKQTSNESKIKLEIEQQNQKYASEIYSLNHRLAENSLLINELKSKRERDQQLLITQSNQISSFRQTISLIEQDNNQLKNFIQSLTNNEKNNYNNNNNNNNSHIKNDFKNSFLMLDDKSVIYSSSNNSSNHSSKNESPKLSKQNNNNNNHFNNNNNNIDKQNNIISETKNNINHVDNNNYYNDQMMSSNIEKKEEKDKKNIIIDNNNNNINNNLEKANGHNIQNNEQNKDINNNVENNKEINDNIDENIEKLENDTNNNNEIDRDEYDNQNNSNITIENEINHKTEPPLPIKIDETKIIVNLPPYSPFSGDEVDLRLAETINNIRNGSASELFPSNFNRLTSGIYQFGTKKIHISLQSQTPFVRVGGAFLQFEKFVKKYGRSECLKLAKHNELATAYKKELKERDSPTGKQNIILPPQRRNVKRSPKQA